MNKKLILGLILLIFLIFLYFTFRKVSDISSESFEVADRTATLIKNIKFN